MYLDEIYTIIKIILPTLIGFLLGRIAAHSKETKEIKEAQDALKDGLLAILRSDIMDDYHKYVVEKDVLTVARREVIDKKYLAYNRNGGNDVGTALYNEICKIPPVVVSKEDHGY